jgi:hypothetical protein
MGHDQHLQSSILGARDMEAVMSPVDVSSLAATLDAVNDALFFGQRLTRPDRAEVATWLVSRQGLPRSYAGMFAPTERDFAQGVRVFTGEKITSGAATGHILGEEALRALRLLGVDTAVVRTALAHAQAGMEARLRESEERGYDTGMYCCGTCSCAYWRALAADGLGQPERRLAMGMEKLKARRLGAGKWRTFPFHYTVLALTDINLPGAVTELRYAASVLERYLKRPAKDDPYHLRRRAIAERALARY